MSTAFITRMKAELKQFELNPIPGFAASPSKNEDGTFNWMAWEGVVPGMKSTAWELGRYPVFLYYNDRYPRSLPLVRFKSGTFHPNIGSLRYLKIPTGMLEPEFLSANLDVRMIMLAIQHILAYPDLDLNARLNPLAFCVFIAKRTQYDAIICRQAKIYAEKQISQPTPPNNQKNN
ncbi:SUMO-conjugating enzyme UBC9-B [Drosophila madeirensis]|uniref:SUMO-conjugating enzyme UBC9-B n=1 Tax=Drosophila madeirensis TaxID=30013 RepID=A0AAU9G105_DROMD